MSMSALPELPAEVAAALRPELPAARERPIARSSLARGAADLGSSYGEAALDAEAIKVASAPQGQRNDTLNSAAFSLAQLVAGGELQEGHVRSTLFDAAIDAGLERGEILATLDSALGAGAQKPRGAPEPDARREHRRRPFEQDSQTPPSIRLLNFREYRSQHRSTASYLIKGLIRQGTVIAVGARPGGGKTAFVTWLSQVLDKGQPFLGRETVETVVAYIAAEDADDVVSRLQALDAEGVLVVQSDEGIPLTRPERAKVMMQEIVLAARRRCPDRPVLVVLDTFRAALGGHSVLEDKFASPALNALRELAEAEGATIAILHHTNRENNMALKGETLEAVAALELILVDGDGDWFALWVGKNRSGAGKRQIARVRYTSVEVDGVSAAIVDEVIAAEHAGSGAGKERRPGTNQSLVLRILPDLLLESADRRRPYGALGPEVKAVRESHLRGEFIKRKSGEDRDTKRKAFTRAMDWLIDRQKVVRHEDAEGTGWIWFASQADEAGPGHFAENDPDEDSA